MSDEESTALMDDDDHPRGDDPAEQGTGSGDHDKMSEYAKDRHLHERPRLRTEDNEERQSQR